VVKDCNIEKFRNNCFRQSKVPGEFMLQLRVPGAALDAKWLEMVQYICQTWGNGEFHFGMRQTFDIPGIKAENVEKVNEYIQPFIKAVECDMCGIEMDTENGYPYIGPRNIMACIGGIHCIKGNINTQDMAHKLEKIIYPNPYHIKISVAGCPNDCAKGHFQDFGIIGCTKPVYDIDRCIGCGACVRKCQSAVTRVLSLNDKGKVDKDICCCVGCGECVVACPTGAWRRPDKQFYKIILGGRTGKQYPRMGKMFANWLTEESVLAIMKNWPKFSEWVLGGKPVYLHGGHLIDRAGYQKFKEFMLQGVTLNPEAYIAETINWTETEYRSNIHVKPLSEHETIE
jgi:anaerobic sulfite reductase subunit C